MKLRVVIVALATVWAVFLNTKSQDTYAFAGPTRAKNEDLRVDTATLPKGVFEYADTFGISSSSLESISAHTAALSESNMHLRSFQRKPSESVGWDSLLCAKAEINLILNEMKHGICVSLENGM
jgi:hypothetical protein